jgi:hypothetical protein
MKRHLPLTPLALLIAAAPAPSAKVYDCTADGAKSAYKLKFGAGEYSTFDADKSQWADNSCTDAKDCKFKGAVFTAAFGPNFFTYTRSTGRYIMADIFGDVTDKGKCVAE